MTDLLGEANKLVERIERAAIMHEGDVWSVPRPGRHCDVIRAIFESTGLPVGGGDAQGFVTNEGRFVGRKEAAEIAVAADQILPFQNGGLTITRTRIDRLYSEDVW